MSSQKLRTIVPGKGVGACCVGANYVTAIREFGRPQIRLAEDYDYMRENTDRWSRFKLWFKRWVMGQGLVLRNFFAGSADGGQTSSSNGNVAAPDGETIINGSPTQNTLLYCSQGVEVPYNTQGEILGFFIFFRRHERGVVRENSEDVFHGTTDQGIGLNSTLADVKKLHGEPTSVNELYGNYSYAYAAEGITYEFKDDRLLTISINKPKTQWWPAEWPIRDYNEHHNWMAFKPAGLSASGTDAQASFLEFARTVEQDRLQPISAYDAAMIQVFVQRTPHNPIVGEFAFLNFVSCDADFVTGTRLNSTDELRLRIESVCDWFLVPKDQATKLGGFSVLFHLASADAHEQQRLLQAQPYSWYTRRFEVTPETELFALPQCTRCKWRYLGVEQTPAGGVCKICRDGGKRCACPSCEAPLIRYPNQPEKCSACEAVRN